MFCDKGFSNMVTRWVTEKRRPPKESYPFRSSIAISIAVSISISTAICIIIGVTIGIAFGITVGITLALLLAFTFSLFLVIRLETTYLDQTV